MVAPVCVAALAASACGGNDDADGSTSTVGEATTSVASESSVAGGSSVVSESSVATESVLGPENRATGDPVRIGFINVEGGSVTSLPQVREAAEAVTAYANEHLGGLGGRPIELVVCKDLSDGASGVACANEFIQNDVVAVVQGLITSEDPVTTVVNAGIPWVGSVNDPANLLNDHVFVLNATGLAIFGVLTKEALDRGYERAMFVVPDQPVANQAVEALLRPMLDNAGIELEFSPVPPGAPDPTPQIAAGLAADPDVVWVVGPTPFCASALPIVVSSSGGDLPIYVNDSCTTPEVIDDVPNGVTSFATYVPGASDEETALYEAVMEEYAEGVELSGSTSFGYFSLLGLIRAVAAAAPSEITAQSVTDAMRAAKDVPLPLMDGKTFTCDGTAIPGFSAVCGTAYIAATVNDGKLTDPRLVDPAGLYDGLFGG